MLRSDAGVFDFVVARIIKADRERSRRATRDLPNQTGYGTTVCSTAEEAAQFTLVVHPSRAQCDGGTQRIARASRPCVFALGRPHLFFIGDIPISPGHWLWLSYQLVAGCQL